MDSGNISRSQAPFVSYIFANQNLQNGGAARSSEVRLETNSTEATKPELLHLELKMHTAQL